VTAPILVMTIGRSGSSMVSGVFAAHGVWVGQCGRADHRNPKGYFENARIKAALKKIHGMPPQVNTVYPPQPGWAKFVRSVLEREGYNGGPWLVKHAAIFHRLWEDWDEPGTVILPRRESAAIFASIRAARFHQFQSDEELAEHIEVQQEYMDRLAANGATEVHSDAVTLGDFATLRAAFDAAGVEFVESIAERFVEESLWHSSRNSVA